MFKKFLLSIILVLGITVRPVSAQTLDYQCLGSSLADYMNAVIEGAGNLANVRLLSPAFNMTSSTFDGIVNGMADNGARFGDLDGIAGNVYNVSGYGMTEWLTQKLANGNISGKDVYLTEAGDKDVADGRTSGFDKLAEEISLLRGNSGGWNVKAALLFNAFNTNDDFSTFSLEDSEIKQVCGGDCGFVGVNTAVGFPISQSNTDKASGFKMQYALAIANRGDVKAVVDTINYAAGKGITIIVRVGVGDNSGGFDDSQDYVNFLKEVNGQVSTVFYAIAGPNEPDSENWASKDCKKNAQSPLEKGFTPLKYACTATADPEFHPLRPYPASPACDPLIPKSIPQASSATDNRFISYSCGSSLAPRIDEAFNAYGENGFYESLAGPDGYKHTTCEKNGSQVVCYRSEKMDITLNLRDSNVGVLGNTQDPNLTDEEKVNNYLSWYLTGTPQIGDQIPLDPNNSQDIDRLINFSGPLRKLLPRDLLNTARITVADSNKKDVHNYLAGDNLFGLDKVRIDRFSGWLGGLNEALLQEIFQNVPFSSLEDIAGEIVMSVFQPGSGGDGQDAEVVGPVNNTAPTKLIIKSAGLAQ